MFKQLIEGTIAISSEWYDNKYTCITILLTITPVLNISGVNENSRNRADLASLSHYN